MALKLDKFFSNHRYSEGCDLIKGDLLWEKHWVD